ncbi:hypothetical protein CcCBS67573_g08881 [Chytriomyces confervae]|uniref:Complex 1 LYR protein domain-containing protein n=1 Tax=Chytriomyces confervae TaxID=246404 RepID=A0A507ECJ5_9FUNG|nr:hypothetical protein CcCBS67573_g08881 [Chytriomyces confervae]
MGIEAISIYRQLLRTQRQLPPQSGRAQRLSEHVRSEIRTLFRDAGASKDLEHARKEALALSQLVNNEMLQRYALRKDSTMLAFLPPRSAYQLLDVAAQDALSAEKVSTLTFFPTYVWGSLKRLMR